MPSSKAVNFFLDLLDRIGLLVAHPLFDIAVAILFRVQLRRVSRQPLDDDLGVARQELGHLARAVRP